MTISLSTYRTPTTTTFDSLFDSLFDPFFASVTTPTRRTSAKNTHVSNEDDKYVISVLAPGLDKEDFNITITEGHLDSGNRQESHGVWYNFIHKDLDPTRRHSLRFYHGRLQARHPALKCNEARKRYTRNYNN